VQTLREDGLIARAAELGERILAGVGEVCRRRPTLVAEVRGRGLLIGLEFADQAAVGEVALELIDRGVLVNHSLNAARVLRLTPPAVLDTGDVDLFLTALDSALGAAEARL